jgi:hypothetical protein
MVLRCILSQAKAIETCVVPVLFDGLPSPTIDKMVRNSQKKVFRVPRSVPLGVPL